MTAQQSGRDYEHEIANAVYEATEHRTVPIRAGFSGNQHPPMPDVIVEDGIKTHIFELKRTTQDRFSVTLDRDPETEDDLSGLLTFASQWPRTVVPYVGVRFTNRQIILAKIWMKADTDAEKLQSAVKTAPTDVRLTKSGNLSFHKPSTDEWPSAQKGDDAEYLLETIGWDD